MSSEINDENANLITTKTLIIIIIDESGSMVSKSSDVIGGFNLFISDQKKFIGDSARVILIKFNTNSTIVHSAIDIGNVSELNNSNYHPCGSTALFDAIADGIRMGESQKGPSERVLCVIMTDGKENSSRRTTHQQCYQMISEKEKLNDWTIVYIGENPERWAYDAHMSPLNSMDVHTSNQICHFRMLSIGTSKLRHSQESKTPDFFDSQSREFSK